MATLEKTELDIARIAAFLDGEGSIQIAYVAPSRMVKKPYFVLHLDISNTDRRLPDWCKKHFGGSVSSTAKKDSKSNRNCVLYRWRTSSKMAEGVLKLALPYFIIKRRQAEIALEFRATFTKRYCRDGVPAEVDALRATLLQELRSHRTYNLTMVDPREQETDELISVLGYVETLHKDNIQ